MLIHLEPTSKNGAPNENRKNALVCEIRLLNIILLSGNLKNYFFSFISILLKLN